MHAHLLWGWWIGAPTRLPYQDGCVAGWSSRVGWGWAHATATHETRVLAAPARRWGVSAPEGPPGGWAKAPDRADGFSFARVLPICPWQANALGLQLQEECVTLEIGERGIFTKVPFSTA